MKNSTISYLACACLVLSGFLFGLFIGRGMSTGVQTEIISPSVPTIAAPTQATPPTQPTNSPEATTSTEPTAPIKDTTPAETTPTETTGPAATQPIPAPGKININTASVAQLMELPGIGEVYAKRIVEYRTLHGPFKTISEITKVEGIGTKRFEAIMDLITTGG